MRKLIGLSVWWLFLVVATLIVETVFGGVPLWVMILIAVALGAVAIPLMFGREIKEWRSRKSPPGSPHELPEDKDLILDDREAVRRNPDNGEAAARLIASVEPFEKAMAIFNDFKLAPRRIAEVRPYVAMVNRLRDEGPTPATVEYLKCGTDEDEYEWAIVELMEEMAKDVPDLPDILDREAIEMLNSLRYPKE